MGYIKSILGLCSLLILIGCNLQPANNEDITLQVKVDWSKVAAGNSGNLGSAANSANSMDALTTTHFGIRVEYTDDNAAFLQSTENTGGDVDLITLNISRTENMRILAAAVQYLPGEADPHVVNMGVKEQVSNKKSLLVLEIGDFTWTEPFWEAGPDFDQLGWPDATVDKNKSREEIEFFVTNPYDVKEPLPYAESKIKLNGTGGLGEYVSDVKQVIWPVAFNPTPGTANQTSETGFPFLDSQQFNLPAARYIVYKRFDFNVHWQ